MSAPKIANINLLPQEGYANTTSGRVLAWLLSTFRYLVITTEMIVIVAFLSRFYFDSRSADLNDEIQQKQEFIQAYSEFEKDFRDTQQRLALYSEVANEKNMASPLIDSVIRSMPTNIFLTNLSVSPQKDILIQGESFGEQDISQFVANLQTEPRFSSVSLSKIESLAGSSSVSFTVNITLSTI